MTATMADFNKTDDVDDVLANDINVVMAATLRAEFQNVVEISANKELTDADTPIQILTPTTDLDVEFAAEATSNHLTFVENPSTSSYNLTIKDDSGVTTFGTIAPGEAVIGVPTASTWKVFFDQSEDDSRYVNVSGDTMTGPLTISSTAGSASANMNMVTGGGLTFGASTQGYSAFAFYNDNDLYFRSSPDTAVDNRVLNQGQIVLALDGVNFRAGIGNTTDLEAKFNIDQSGTSAAIPVQKLDQADVDEPFTKYIGTAAVADGSRSIVASTDVASSTDVCWVKIEVQDNGNVVTDADYYIQAYTIST